VPLAVARDRQRVDREHLIAGREQRLHPRAAVGLDPDDDPLRLLGAAAVLPDQLVQQRDPADALR
jgi:hypothetical protein